MRRNNKPSPIQKDCFPSPSLVLYHDPTSTGTQGISHVLAYASGTSMHGDWPCLRNFLSPTTNKVTTCLFFFKFKTSLHVSSFALSLKPFLKLQILFRILCFIATCFSPLKICSFVLQACGTSSAFREGNQIFDLLLNWRPISGLSCMWQTL